MSVPCHRRGRRSRGERGFTLLELAIVVTILAILATVGVPQYLSALRTARIGKSKHELVTIACAIDAYTAGNSGRLPLTLHQVGFGGRRDPWGVPYCYLNYADGTGDGLQWAIAAGLVDPGAFQGDPGGGGGSGGGGGGAVVPRRIGFAPRRPQGDVGVSPARRAAARAQAAAVATALDRDMTLAEVVSLETSIATSASFSLFVGVDSQTTRRRDRYLFPLNTDYDLFSLGPDSRTAVSLGETVGLDDVIRANNGGFFGPASEY
jgi:general secretion pathway protein G